ncbi:MAG: cellulase family glycosylhydrolase [Flavobacteriaceae bacterium]|nr:cellulase family glycosylhydrolase [Flavobacteriaceae bacterium]
MVNTNKAILRVVLVLSYIVLIGLVVFGISALFSYLNTGADRSNMLHTEVKKIDQYLPDIEWSELNNLGREISQTTLNELENDYLDAWYVKHVAFMTNIETGIDDYYTESARENIFNIIALNKADSISIEGTTLSHQPTLEFYSEDGQLAVITDRNVLEFKRIYEADKMVLETREVSTYKVLMLLEDGFWRIRHMVKEEVAPYKDEIDTVKLSGEIKGINYYPQGSPWDLFGDYFDESVISDDFKLIKASGLNSVRVFIPYEDFGKANVKKEKLNKLKLLLDLALIHDLKVILTLFDFYGDYSVLDWTLNREHARTIVSEFKDHEAIMAWDLKNEPNLDFDSRGRENVMAWLETMIDLVKSVDEIHPVTIGWSNAGSAPLLKENVDFVSFHYYDDIDKIGETYTNLKTSIEKPVAITEFGLSSYRGLWNPFGHSETTQAEYHKIAQEQFKNLEIPYMSWTLYDFEDIPREVVGRLPWRKNAQKQFGFINVDGGKKESFNYISKD